MENDALVIQALLASPEVAAILGTRIFPVSLPQACTFPAATVTRVSGGPEYADDGPIGLDKERLQIDCWSKTCAEVKAASAAIAGALEAIANDSIEAIFIDDIRDFRESGAAGEDYPYGTSISAIVWSNTA